MLICALKRQFGIHSKNQIKKPCPGICFLQINNANPHVIQLFIQNSLHIQMMSVVDTLSKRYFKHQIEEFAVIINKCNIRVH